MKQVLITGAHGFIGRHLAKECKEVWNAAVLGLGHGTFTPHEMRRWGLQATINGDVSSANLERIAAESGVPDVIFHLAGGSAVGPSLRIPQEDFRRTASSTCDLLDWVRINAPKACVVLASSAAVYGAGHRGPIREDATVAPYSPYGYHKHMAELLCESYSKNFDIRTRVVRLFSVYGPELRKQLLWDTCQKLSSGNLKLLMHGTGNESRDWLHISDCVAFLCKVSEATLQHCVVNCGTGTATPVKEIVQSLCNNWKSQMRDAAIGKIAVTFSGEVRPGDPPDLVADNHLARSMAWEPKSVWPSGIAQYVEWFRRTQCS